MNILIYAPQMAPYGGIERHVCCLAPALARRGHRVVLVTTSNSLGAELRAPLLESGVDFRELQRERGAASNKVKALWLLSVALRARVKKWDVVVTQGQSALSRIMWWAAGRRTRVIHHHHTAADAGERAGWSPSFLKVMRDVPELVACSRATANELSAALGRSDVRFLPYATPHVLDASAVRETRPGDGEPLHFGFLGRLDPSKGIAVLCELSRRADLADIRWHVHGAGPDFPPAYFESFPNVVYHGRYSGPVEQAKILQQLHAVALFSLHAEGMPLSLIECMSAGLPWIATDRGGTREIAVSAANCRVVSADLGADRLAPAVRDLADAIRAGTTSRAEQRLAYDRTFAPEVVIAQWSDYLEKPLARN